MHSRRRVRQYIIFIYVPVALRVTLTVKAVDMPFTVSDSETELQLSPEPLGDGNPTTWTPISANLPRSGEPYVSLNEATVDHLEPRDHHVIRQSNAYASFCYIRSPKPGENAARVHHIQRVSVYTE